MRGCDVSKGLQVYKINDVFLFHEVTFALSDNLPHAQTGSPWRDSGKRAKVGLFKDWTGKLQAPLPLRGQADGLGQVHGEKGKVVNKIAGCIVTRLGKSWIQIKSEPSPSNDKK